MLRKKGVLSIMFFVLIFMLAGQVFSQPLPTSFDWRTQGCVTSVKNQGANPDSWAFAVLGSYEAAILVDNGPKEDLSEQFLVDSFGGLYNYVGGNWGLNLMMNGTPRGDSYTAGGLADLPGCFKGYPLSCWLYVDTATTVPTNDAIKQAIYYHGPVCAAVCVGTAFMNYTSGIFNRNETGTVNHGVVLVGWNDDLGCWILKNSWGTSWGESGYMRIAYGCSQVGYGAAYGIPTDHRCLGANRWYKFVNRFNGDALDVGTGSYVYHYPYNGGTDKQWKIIPVGSGWVKIENRFSGYVLDVSTGTDYVYQYAYNGGTDKHWDIIYHDSGFYKVYNMQSADYMSTGANVYVYHYPWNGNADKQWEIIEVF